MASVSVLDSVEFRPGEDLFIGVYRGRLGYSLQGAHILYGRCIEHSGNRDIWGDAYRALYRQESAMPILDLDENGNPVPLEPPSQPRSRTQTETSKQRRVTHVTCFVERSRARVQDASARFTVSINSAGRVRGEAVATGHELIEFRRMRLDPSQTATEIVLAVLLHLATVEHEADVASLMKRMRSPGEPGVQRPSE